MRCIFHSAYEPNAHFTVRTDCKLLLRTRRIRLCILNNPLQEAQILYCYIFIRISDTCLVINSFLSWPKTTKFNSVVLMVSFF